MASASPLPLALAFCAGSMLTVLVWSVSAQPGGSSGSEAPGDQAGVIAELRDLRASVEKLGRLPAANGPTQMAGAEMANPVAARSPDLSPLLESLGRTLERLDQKLTGSNGGPVGLTQARELRRETDWKALLPIAQAMTRDSQQAKRAVRFLTPTELLERSVHRSKSIPQKAPQRLAGTTNASESLMAKRTRFPKSRFAFKMAM